MDDDIQAIIERAPKIELHAHLNGSLSLASVHELCSELYGTNLPNSVRNLRDQLVIDSTNLADAFKRFEIMHELSSTKKGLRLLTEFVIRDFANDNVVYLELRTTPKANLQMSKMEYLDTVLKAIDNAKASWPSIDVKLLVSFNRSESIESADSSLDAAVKMNALYPGVIKGVDLSGSPFRGKFASFKPILERARANGLKVALHCGESEDQKDEIVEMLEFGMDRCGHGTFLTDEQFQLLAKRNIGLECCLTSNVKCQTVDSYKDHHIAAQLRKGYRNVMLCTDDAGVFETTLSKEFQLAAIHMGIRLRDCFQLTENAIEQIFNEDTFKQKLRDKLHAFEAKYNML